MLNLAKTCPPTAGLSCVNGLLQHGQLEISRDGRYTLISDISNGNKTLYDADLFSSSKSSPIGTINGEESLNKINIGKVEKLDNTEKRVSEDLYNSIIQYGKQKGHDLWRNIRKSGNYI